MEMLIRLHGANKISAEFDSYQVVTDQPVEAGGTGSAPTPFQLFLASLGTCAGVYVGAFCEQRGIPTEEITIHQTMEFTESADGKQRLAKVGLEIRVPPEFPEKYHNALVKSAELCTVKKTLANPPDFAISTRVFSNEGKTAG
ncbi:MAG: OsmC family protein [Geobacter sp.]|nr:OsmC family protein [Geobacter sp.]